MTPQIAGTLKTWNSEKGFGFITPANGGQDIFIHISNYPREGGPPKVGESLLFEVTLNNEGKKKAINVSRPGQSQESRKPLAVRHRERHDEPSVMGRVMTGLLVVAVLGAGYKYLLPRFTAASETQLVGADSSSLASNSPSAGVASFRCDGRSYCSQMTSCEEAKYFLKNCPNTEMDGDRDGVPCESQWCTSPFAK